MLRSFGKNKNSTRLNMMDEEWLWAIFSRHARGFFLLFFFFLHKDWFLLIEAWPMYPQWEMDPRVHVHIEDNSVLVPILLLWWSSFWNSLLRMTSCLKGNCPAVHFWDLCACLYENTLYMNYKVSVINLLTEVHTSHLLSRLQRWLYSSTEQEDHNTTVSLLKLEVFLETLDLFVWSPNWSHPTNWSILWWQTQIIQETHQYDRT